MVQEGPGPHRGPAQPTSRLNVERLQLTRIRELLAARGCQVAYSSLHRFLARRNWRAEVDFGRLGLMLPFPLQIVGLSRWDS